MPGEKENTDVSHPKEGAWGFPFLEVGLNFKVSGQRQLKEAGFQAARGALLLAAHPWPRSQPGTVTRPWGKRQPEPRGGFGINSKKNPPHTPCGKEQKPSGPGRGTPQPGREQQAALPALSAGSPASGQGTQCIPCPLEPLRSSSPSSGLQEPGRLSERERATAMERKGEKAAGSPAEKPPFV